MDNAAWAANRILLRFITDKETKLLHGARLRAEIHEQIARGIEPSGYRVDWITKTVGGLFGWLSERAAEFNAAHPQDAISTDDLSDVLATAESRLKNRQSR